MLKVQRISSCEIERHAPGTVQDRLNKPLVAARSCPFNRRKCGKSGKAEGLQTENEHASDFRVLHSRDAHPYLEVFSGSRAKHEVHHLVI